MKVFVHAACSYEDSVGRCLVLFFLYTRLGTRKGGEGGREKVIIEGFQQNVKKVEDIELVCRKVTNERRTYNFSFPSY